MFADRADAGRRLGVAVREALSDDGTTIVLGLPRGGVPVAVHVAAALGVDLDVLVVRKLGHPGNPEVATGAIGPDGTAVFVGDSDGSTRQGLEETRAREFAELRRREQLYRAGRAPLDLTGVRAVLVDDGIATGSTAIAAVRAARLLGAREVVVAAPVAPPDARGKVAAAADALIVLACPPDFWAVGQWYRDFGQTSDDEVIAALA